MTKAKQGGEEDLLRDIKELTSREFVYEDLWCGMVPFDGELTELQTGPPVPFAELTWREQADILREFIHWGQYPKRDWNDEYKISDNIAVGKQSEQWLEGTALSESFQLLAEGKTPPPAKECPEITQEDLAKVFDSLGKEGNVPEGPSAGAKAFQDILGSDQPTETETKTQEG